MPEFSTFREPKTRIDPASLLSPEAYKDFSVQRRIIGYFATGGDTIVFKQPDFEATQGQAVDFSRDLSKSRFRAEDVSQMLLNLSDGMGKVARNFNLYDFAETIKEDSYMGTAVGRLMGKSTSEITIGDIEQYLNNNPSPIEANKIVNNWANSLHKTNTDGDTIQRLQQGGKRALDRLYGDRQIYWQNLRLMIDRANSETNRKGRVKPQASRAKKLTRRASSLALSTLMASGSMYAVQDLISDGRIDGPFAVGEVSMSRGETDLENSIEQKYGIEILDVREAFKILARNFNVYDENELGNRPPTRWDEDQMKLLDELLAKLPPNFYSSKGETLNFSLTDYGKNCPCAGTFHENRPNLRHALVLLSDSNFRREKGDWPFHLLTHELAHRVDIDVLEGKLWPEVTKILGFDTFEEARITFVPKLEDVAKAIPGLDSLKSKIHYGLMGINDAGLNEPAELIAVLAETYVDGFQEFEKIGKFFGEEKARQLYELLKTEMFEGMEYEGTSPNDRTDEIDKTINQEEKTDLEYAAEFKTVVEAKFNVVIDDSSAPLGMKEMDRIFAALSAFPDSFLKEKSGKNVSIKIYNGDSPVEDHGTHDVSFFKWEIDGSPNAYTGVQQGISVMTRQLLSRYSQMNDSKPVKIISNLIKERIELNKDLMEDLGIDDMSQLDQVAVEYGALYIAGWDRFYNLGVRRLDHEAMEAGVEDEQAREQKQFIYRLYKLIGETFYQGNEYVHGREDGIPFIVEDSSE